MKQRKIHLENIGKHLTQEQLISYSRADLGIDEMYRLELHLIDCELCSMALEGLESARDQNATAKDISFLKESVVSSDEFRFGPIHLSAAAVGLILIVSAIVFFNREPSETVLADNQIEKLEQEESLDKQAQQEPVLLTEDTANVEIVEIISTEPEEANQDPIIEESRSEQPVSSEENVQRLSESITDETDEPLLADSPITEDSKVVTEESVSGAETAAPAASRMAQPSTTTAKKARVDVPEAEIIGGNSSLRRHIRRNLQYPDDAKSNSIKGTVKLLVTVSTDGAISDITVIEGLGYGCDEEAMRLIRTGPGWQAAEINGVSVVSQKEVEVRFR